MFKNSIYFSCSNSIRPFLALKTGENPPSTCVNIILNWHKKLACCIKHGVVTAWEQTQTEQWGECSVNELCFLHCKIQPDMRRTMCD